MMMKPPRRKAGLSLVCVALMLAGETVGQPGEDAAADAAVSARPLDTVEFGVAASETAHNLQSASTKVIDGALGQSARRCLPLEPVSAYGGSLTFTVAVDPVRRNYFSLKLWGGDDTDYQMGRLYLYVPLDGVDYQVGYRHEGDYLPLSVTHGHPPLPGRFFYTTTLLPLGMTRGKASLTVKIVSTGRLYPFGSGGPESKRPYQFGMDRPGRAIYRAYTHVDAYLDVSGEKQGCEPETTVRPGPGPEVLAPDGEFTRRVNNHVAKLMQGKERGDAQYLAHAYHIPELECYHKKAVVERVVEMLDAETRRFYENPKAAEGWGGAYGSCGIAMYCLRNELGSPVLDKRVDYGAGGSKNRREAWGDMLFASREFGRLRNRRGLSNQAMIANGNIYGANKGLLVLRDRRAFPETEAQRYIKEACGLLPWRGNDRDDGGHEMPFGDHYYQVTEKGQTREWGYVGAGYGDMAIHLAEWHRVSGNPEFLDQMIKMGLARAPFRRPAIEIEGGNLYRTMEAIGLLVWRGAHESDGNYAGYVAYADTANTNEGGRSLRVAAESGHPALMGFARQMLEDNQFFVYALRSVDRIESLDVFADYRTIMSASGKGFRLPMTDGQPDFAWADEDNRIVALKNGDDRLWVAAYWHAKAGRGINGGTGINGIARFHYSTATHDQYGVLETTPRFMSKSIFIRPDYIDDPGGNGHTRTECPRNAYAGEMLPLAIVPDDAKDPGPFGGKADFYAFRFGRYLFGINADANKAYPLKTHSGFVEARELVAGSFMKGNISVAPRSTVVLDLSAPVDPAPVPNAPLALLAEENSLGSIQLEWSASSGAETYTVCRSLSADGPYEPLSAATGIASTHYTEALAAGSGRHYYCVYASNANGNSYPSMVVRP